MTKQRRSIPCWKAQRCCVSGSSSRAPKGGRPAFHFSQGNVHAARDEIVNVLQANRTEGTAVTATTVRALKLNCFELFTCGFVASCKDTCAIVCHALGSPAANADNFLTWHACTACNLGFTVRTGLTGVRYSMKYGQWGLEGYSGVVQSCP
eukprot:359074-Chlamydomonas_euryale.AAC.6